MAKVLQSLGWAVMVLALLANCDNADTGSSPDAVTVDAAVDTSVWLDRGNIDTSTSDVGDTATVDVRDTSTGDVGDMSTGDMSSGDVVDTNPPGRVPERHRATATQCDGERPYLDPGVPPDGEGPPVSCRTHEECTDGTNGRCGGNGHDGWYCTYDQCTTDSECDGKVCECEGGFRSDADVCLREGNCLVDADCGVGGYCSPSFGDCGSYMGVVAYFCHTAADECVDDVDCGDEDSWGPYCAYNRVSGRWTCSESHCAG